MYLHYINNHSVTVIHMKWSSIDLMNDLGLYNQGKLGLCSLPGLQKVKTRQVLVRMLSHCANVQTSPNVEEQALMLVIYCLQCPNLMVEDEMLRLWLYCGLLYACSLSGT